MKTIEEILNNPRIARVDIKTEDGFRGIITMPKWTGSIICSWMGGWEHCSVSPFNKRIVPSWEDMTTIKNIVWKDDEYAIEIHPPKDMYVDNLPNCLHLWKCYYKEMIMPPSCFVGIRKGQSAAELQAEVRQAFELAGEEWK